MHIQIKNLVDKKIAILESFRNIAVCGEAQIDRAIELTNQCGVQHARITRLFKISTDNNDAKRVKAGRIEAENVRFPRDISQHAASAEASYHRAKNHYQRLPANVETNSNPAKIAAVKPQAINLITLLESQILGARTITDINNLIAILNNVSQICDLAGKASNSNILDALGILTDLAKQTTERHASAKSTKDLLLYTAALEGWVGVANMLIDYVDSSGSWSYRDFR